MTKNCKKMGILLFFLIIFNVFCINYINFSCAVYANSLVEFNGQPEHIFTHCLIAYPDIAFSKSNSMAKDYARDCITVNEFKSILKQLYSNDYILINPNLLFEKKNDIILRKKLFLPRGKKPLIFSFDDVCYDSKKLGKGMVDKIVLNNDTIFTQTNHNGKNSFSKENEFIPILEAFINENPDFSHLGAKGMICLTGYDGILGYRTQPSNENSTKERLAAKRVINQLKKDGWTFACHSYGHYHMKKRTAKQIADEIKKWEDEVVPLIGKSNIYVYPYGEWEILDKKGNISEKHKLLKNAGFQLFCGVGVKPFISFFPKGFNDKDKVLFMDRRPIDGFSIKNRCDSYRELFDCNLVYDKKYRYYY